jgi:enoyl-CoA hydratase
VIERQSVERAGEGAIAVLTLAHGKANALDLELLEALEAASDELAGSEAAAVVLTGRGAIFSAGVDLFRLLAGGADYLDRFLPALDRAVRKLFALPLPVVAAVNGHAIAGGAVLTLACDYRLMAAGSGRIGVPELLVGVPFPAAPLEVVRFALPPHRLQEAIYTGRTDEPEEALARGWLDEVVEPERLSARALEVAGRLAALPPDAFRLTKRQVRRPAIERMERLGADFGAAVREQWIAEGTRERIRVYLERTVGKRA